MARDWMSTYLRSLGAPDTTRNRSFLGSWQQREGGHTHNSARFNYMNTTQRMPGSSAMNSVGVQSYRNLQQGASAFARTLRNGRYGDLVQGLRSGDPYKAQPLRGLSTWLSGSPTKGQDYARQVLGTHVAAPAPKAGGVPGVPGTPGTPARTRIDTSFGVKPNFGKIILQNMQQMAQSGDDYNPLDMSQQLVQEAVRARGVRVTKRTIIPGLPGVPPVQAEIEGKVTPRDHKAINLAKHFLGTPYSWGGGGPSGPTRGIAQGANTVGFDCSGLIEFVWARQGIKVGGTTYEQIKNGRAVNPSTKSLRPGDAVFFGDPKAPHHVGMYVGGGKFIESPHTGATVRISTLAGRKPSAARRYG